MAVALQQSTDETHVAKARLNLNPKQTGQPSNERRHSIHYRRIPVSTRSTRASG